MEANKAKCEEKTAKKREKRYITLVTCNNIDSVIIDHRDP